MHALNYLLSKPVCTTIFILLSILFFLLCLFVYLIPPCYAKGLGWSKVHRHWSWDQEMEKARVANSYTSGPGRWPNKVSHVSLGRFSLRDSFHCQQVTALSTHSPRVAESDFSKNREIYISWFINISNSIKKTTTTTTKQTGLNFWG